MLPPWGYRDDLACLQELRVQQTRKVGIRVGGALAEMCTRCSGKQEKLLGEVTLSWLLVSFWSKRQEALPWE